MRSIVRGRSLLVVMPTGSGKSLLYQLPALLADGVTLVISPLISLMKDQVDELTRKRIPATFVNSSLSIAEQHDRLRRAGDGAFPLVYIAPERFRNASFLRTLDDLKVARMAVDEAHCISEWGHDFRPDYRRLKECRERMGSPPVTALTATATPRVQRDIITSLGLAPDEVDLHVHGFDRPNLVLGVVETPDRGEKERFLADFVREHDGPGIVYTGTRRAAEDAADAIRAVDPSVTIYHAGMESDDRTAAQEAFLGGAARVVCATSAFGMGIDKRDVRFVVHTSYPGSVEQYYQEIGRAGRDGLTSHCVLLYAPSDRFLREFFIDLSYPTKRIVADVCRTLWRIDANPIMMTYKEIAAECAGDVKDGQVGSSVRLLDHAGVTRAFSGETRLAVTLDKRAPEVLPNVRGRARRAVLEGLAFAVDLEVPGRYEVDLAQLCVSSGLTEDQVRRALAAMDRDGVIRYEPPFRGRGIEKRVDDAPKFGELDIDWKRQEMLRGIEEEKLAAMEDYIRSPACRRGFILKYFGETDAFTCGTCDRCETGAGGGEGNVLDRHPAMAMAALVAMRHLPFSLGKIAIARLLRGSRDKKLLKWRLDRNPAYGRVNAKPDVIKGVIDDLTYEGYLELKGDGRRPMLALTERGEEVSRDVDLDQFSTPAPPAAEMPKRERSLAAPVDDDTARRAVLDCIAGLPFAVGAGKIAEVLTGSKAKWIEPAGAHALPVYGSVGRSRQEIRTVIDAMLADGTLEKGGSPSRPVLEITSECATVGLSSRADTPESPTRVPPSLTPTSSAPRPAPLPRKGEGEGMEEEATARAAGVAEMLDAMIDELLVAEREVAKRLVGELLLFHPREIVRRLVERFEGSTATRVRSRAVWAAGELGGTDALPFLTRCVASETGELRERARKALTRITRNNKDA